MNLEKDEKIEERYSKIWGLEKGKFKEELKNNNS